MNNEIDGQGKLDRLTKIGFRPAGQWTIVNGQLVPDLIEYASARNVLYTFVVDGMVMYIGKTIQPLRSRMQGYRLPGPTQSTNIRNHQNIRSLLETGKSVEIYVLADNGLLRYGDFHVNLAAGLEDDLVHDLDPPWNGGRKESGNTPLPAAEQLVGPERGERLS